MSKQNKIVMAALALILAAGLVFWFLSSRESVNDEKSSGAESLTGDKPAGLGAEIYEENQNPIEGEIGASNPAENANPIDDVYKNPFGG